MTRMITLSVLLLSSAALAAPAGDPSSVVDPQPVALARGASATARPVQVMLGMKAGGLFPQPFSSLGVAPTGQLEIGALLLQRRLAVFIDAGYAQPSTSGTVSDGRVPGGQASWNVTVQQLDLSIGGAYRIPLNRLTPYAGAAFRIQMQKAVANGAATSNALGENSQSATQLGAVLLGGADLALGPGALLAELQVGYAGINRTITGSSNTGSIGLLLGYRLVF